MEAHAVLASIPETTCANTPASVAQQRVYAAAALGRSAALSGAPSHGYQKDDSGAPLPNDGWYWSVTHKRHWSAAVVSRERIGIDVEALLPRSDEHFKEIATHDEWSLFPALDTPSLIRAWTAKEAIVKANGVGVGAMDRCRLSHVPDTHSLEAEFEGERWRVVHYYLEQYMASVAFLAGAISWHVVRDMADIESEPSS